MQRRGRPRGGGATQRSPAGWDGRGQQVRQQLAHKLVLEAHLCVIAQVLQGAAAALSERAAGRDLALGGGVIAVHEGGEHEPLSARRLRTRGAVYVRAYVHNLHMRALSGEEVLDMNERLLQRLSVRLTRWPPGRSGGGAARDSAAACIQALADHGQLGAGAQAALPDPASAGGGGQWRGRPVVCRSLGGRGGGRWAVGNLAASSLLDSPVGESAALRTHAVFLAHPPRPKLSPDRAAVNYPRCCRADNLRSSFRTRNGQKN